MKNSIVLSFLAIALLSISIGGVQAEEKPLKVFILAGQSNMQGHAHVRTMNVMRLDATTAPLLKVMQNEDGSAVVCEDVWISSLGSSEDEKIGRLTTGFGAEPRGPKIGPEFTFGIFMQKHLDEPILIIKTAWGGKSINTDFRPPNAGPYEFNQQQLNQFAAQEEDRQQMQEQKDEATGVYYRAMLEHIELVLSDIKRVYPDYDENQGYEIAGFVWFQGWNDMVDRGTYPTRDQEGGYDAYSTVMAHFIRDVREDLAAPDMPFVIGVLGVGGPTSEYTQQQMRYKGIHDNFRNAMAAPADLAEFRGNVAAVWTDQMWDMDLKNLRLKDSEIQAAVKEQAEQEQLNGEQTRALTEEKRAEVFDDDELELLTDGASNAEYHYLGSAKIMARIGKGFADAMAELMRE